MQLVLERCTIRPWRLDDAESLANHASNRKVWLGLRDAFPHPYTIEDAHEFIRRATADQPETKFCIEIDGAVAGGIGVHPGQDVHRHTATVGYWLGEDFWGRGIMTEAVIAFTDFCFENLALDRIFAEVLRTILHQHGCSKRPASSLKHASRTTSSKTESFSIHCSTARRNKIVNPATCVSRDQGQYGSPQNQ